MVPRTEQRRAELRAVRRFVVVGGANTAMTWAAFAVLARLIDPRVAYTLVFAAGLAFTTFATRRYVFGAARSLRRSVLFVGWYLFVYAVGVSLVDQLDTRTDLAPELLALVVVGATAPLTFLGGRIIFRESRPASQEDGSW